MSEVPSTLFRFRDLFPELELIQIVDVGAMSVGGEAAPYQHLLEDKLARVTGFEPNAEECRKLNANLDESQRYLPYFIGEGGPATYYETNQVMTGSLYEPNTPLLSAFQNLAELVTPVAQHPIQTHRLDDLHSEIPDCDLLKMDIQGAELSALRGGQQFLTHVSVIQIEANFVPLYKDMPLFAEVDQHLRSQGFLFHTFHGIAGRAFKPFLKANNVNMPLRQILWSDAIYVRNFLEFAQQPVSKLLRLAAVLHEVYGSFDLAYKALEATDQLEGTGRALRYLQGFARTPV